LWPLNNNSDDLTTLHVLLAGPEGTPYSSGLFHLHLTIPPTYPQSPPTAAFKTKLWHPNIEEGTGKVCVETLKRDWRPELKLYDVLVVIGCLLVQPNPGSALNASAAEEVERGWNVFERRAKMMTNIYARVPKDLEDAVREAKARGETEGDDDRGSDAKTKVAKGKRKAVRDDDVEGENPQMGKTAKASSSKNMEPLALGTDNVFGISGLPSTSISTIMDIDTAPPSPQKHHLNSGATSFQSTSTHLTSAASESTTPPNTPPAQRKHHPKRSTTPPFSPPPLGLPSMTALFSEKSEKAISAPLYLFWYKSFQTEKTPERLAREKVEHRRLKAAGWNLKLYNKGFGSGVREKRGLGRL